MANLELRQINKIYNNGFRAVKNFNLKIKKGEFIVLVGPSGCGKTTVLRMIAGLESITDGELYMDDSCINHINAKDRDMAIVFQNYALFPHLTVYGNISFPLKMAKLSGKEIHNKVKIVADILELEDILDKKPNTLSGGQKQRVALGRAMVRNPRVFLMDEPLSNLDANLRTQMRIEISKLHRKLATTFIYVTHDQIEAMTMATKIIIMKDGEIQQIGTPEAVYKKPNNIFVAKFIGNPSMNIFDGAVVLNGQEVQIMVNVRTDNDKSVIYLKIPKYKQNILQHNNYINKVIRIGIRPENMGIADKRSSNILKVSVSMVETIGLDTYVYFNINDENCVMKTNIDNGIRIGDNISFYMDKEKIYLFDYETGLRIV